METALSGTPQGCCEIGEFALQGPRIPRIDNFLDQERFGRTEGRMHVVQSFLNILQQGVRVIGRGQTGLVGGLDSAFDGQRAPITEAAKAGLPVAAARLRARHGNVIFRSCLTNFQAGIKLSSYQVRHGRMQRNGGKQEEFCSRNAKIWALTGLRS